MRTTVCFYFFKPFFFFHKDKNLNFISKLSQQNQIYQKLKQIAACNTTTCTIQVSNSPLISFRLTAPHINLPVILEHISSLSSLAQIPLQFSGKSFTESQGESPDSFSRHLKSKSCTSSPVCPCWLQHTDHLPVSRKPNFLYPSHALVQMNTFQFQVPGN